MAIYIRRILFAVALIATLPAPVDASQMLISAVVGGDWDGTSFIQNTQNFHSWRTLDLGGSTGTLYMQTDFDSDWTTNLVSSGVAPNFYIDGFTGVPINGPTFNVRIAGDGFYPGAGNVASDPYYLFFMSFSNNVTVSAIFNATPGHLGLVTTSSTSPDYKVLNFSWFRPPQVGAPAVDYVSGITPVPGNNPSDYVGLIQLSLPIQPVPEPTTLALAGLGGVSLAFGAYRRRRATTV